MARAAVPTTERPPQQLLLPLGSLLAPGAQADRRKLPARGLFADPQDQKRRDALARQIIVALRHSPAEEKGWWIVRVPNGWEEMGPYATKAEALDDLRGLRNFLRYGDEPGFASAVPTAKPAGAA
jgi:hypothetical protein